MKYIEYFFLSLILVLALSLRIYKLNSPIADWHSWRQTATASVADIFVKGEIDVLHPKTYDISTSQTGYYNPEGYWYVEMPLYQTLHASFYKFTKFFSFEVTGRLISVVASLFSVVAIWGIAKKIGNSSFALTSALIFATLPFNIYYSRVILPEPIAVALGLFSIWNFLKYLDSNHLKNLLMSSIFIALSILVKPFTICYLGVIIFLAYRKYGFKLLVNKKIYIYLVIALLPFVLWRVWISQFPEGIPHTKWAFNGDGIRFRPAFWRWIFGERLGYLILGVWGLVPFVLGILSKRSFAWFVRIFLFVSFIMISIFATANVRHDYYQVIFIPSVVFSVSLGFYDMWNSEALNKYISRLFVFVCLFMMFGMSWFQIREYYKINHPEIIEAGVKVDKLVPKDARIIAPYNKDMAFLYQTKRFGWPFVDGSIEDMIEKGARYYVSVNYDPVTLELMEKHEVIDQNQKYVIIRLENSNP